MNARPPDLSPLDVAPRLGRLRQAMGEAGYEALLVSNLTNIRYLTGFSGSAGLLLVLEEGEVLLTDGRYATQAQEELGWAGVGARVEARRAPEQAEVLKKLVAGTKRLGLEADHVSWGAQRRWLEGWAEGMELVPTSRLVEALREKKSPSEVARVGAAASIADQALSRVSSLFHQNPSEAELALALDVEMRRLGSEGTAFETIVAAGPNAAKPHHRPSGRQVEAGEMVVVDFGARVDGYCSDMTRTIWVSGRVTPELREIYSVVLASQEAGLAAVRDGAKGAAVDRACREVVEAAGWGEKFVHGTGHGVGLDIHEAPAVAATSEDILTCGHVVTIEPGIYVPGFGGVRIEDTVVVEEGGCRALTASPKQAPGESLSR
jgi:Xaa-Pro aminopeptidase